ncbi:glycerophosphodiester phosphodiesterase family protein [Mucilaginibacter paludis]|nr:glycerophosphodiester phosphodiesterase family protein [Mucilaginibacter paludis]
MFTQTVMAQQEFDKQGHRGCRGLMPENTIPAMKKAVDLGATLEMDISFSQDKVVIVSHDQYLSSLIALKPNGDTISKAEEKQLILYQMPYRQIEQYILGQKKYPLFPNQQQVKTHIPLLASLIDSIEAYAKQTGKPAPKYNIETKTTVDGDNVLHPGPEEFVERLMQVILQKGIQSRVTIQSFDIRTLEIIHKKYAYMQTAFLVSGGSLRENLALLSFKPTIYSPAYKTVTQEVVADCHAAQIKILPWTVNSAEAIKRLKDWGVDGIISDYPDRL